MHLHPLTSRSLNILPRFSYSPFVNLHSVKNAPGLRPRVQARWMSTLNIEFYLPATSYWEKPSKHSKEITTDELTKSFKDNELSQHIRSINGHNLELSPSDIFLIMGNLPILRSIELQNATIKATDEQHDLPSPSMLENHKLGTLILKNACLSQDDFLALIKPLKSLIFLNLGKSKISGLSQKLNPDDFTNHHLEILHLHHTECSTANLRQILKCFPKLEAVDISFCKNINSTSLKSIIKEYPHVKFTTLGIYSAPLIGSRNKR